jgi:hypothetical protein
MAKGDLHLLSFKRVFKLCFCVKLLEQINLDIFAKVIIVLKIVRTIYIYNFIKYHNYIYSY